MKNITQLISTINDVHSELQASVANAVNKALTIRNWLIGYYIVEYEQKGEDRAEYGDKVIDTLAQKLKSIKGIDKRSLYKFRQFYLVYQYLTPTIKYYLEQNFGAVSQKSNFSIVGSVTTQLGETIIRGTLTPEFDSKISKVGAVTTLSNKSLLVPSDIIISKLSYTHLELLLNVSEPLKRTFYEIECIKGTWSVRELKRQIASLYFERSGLSQHPEKLAELVQQKTQPQQPKDIIKNIYAFEFLDIRIQPIVEESDLETALLDNLQQFIIELGNGFCLEARQKRILIGETYYFIDLVFYHRILKCHVLVELKIGAFDHGDIGQLNTYLNFFKAEIAEANDNPPVGILLVAEKDHALVKYATAGMDENLFVQQYLVQLPSQEQLVNHIETELKHFRNE
ncbi:MAG: DUF1016 family protein [Saprospiraceae bacterium]|nr:DUF1016 family protein [Saprospiraceae bacterium]